MQGQEFLGSPWVLEAQLTSFLLSGGLMGRLNEVIAASSGDHLDALHAVEDRESSNSCSIAPKLFGVDHVWDVVIRQQSFKRSLGCLGASSSLSQGVKDCARVIDGPPAAKRRHRHCSGQEQPEFPVPDLDADLLQEPPGIPTGFTVPQFFGEEGCELDVPLGERLVADENAALVKQFLAITLAQGEPMAEPRSVLNDAERKPVAVRLAVNHRRQAYCALTCQHPLVSLPPYAPELNPYELVWAYIKRSVLKNCCIRTLKERRVQLVKAWQRVRSIRFPQRLMDANLRRDQ